MGCKAAGAVPTRAAVESLGVAFLIGRAAS
jgi:hypothetical protein